MKVVRAKEVVASEREREIARLGLKYGADGWKPLAPDHKPGVIDPVGSILLEVDETHPPAPIPMYLTCPKCNERHIDEGEFATRVHHTHSCQRCGLTWRPAVVPTIGVAFLPGFKNEPAAFMTFQLTEQEPSIKGLIERGRQALVATAEEPVCEREIGVRDALRDLLFHLLSEGETLDLDTHP
jgi:hypothetical protein